MYFDSHTHLNEKRLFADIERVLLNAKTNGVTTMMVPSYDIPSLHNAIILGEKYHNIYIALGIHPSDAKRYPISVINDVKKLAKGNAKVKAIGEIGLDYYWDKTEKERAYQKEMFIRQIELANALQLPVIVHMRDASEDTLEILRKHTPKYGFLMHCYSGSLEMLEDILALGGYISFGGPVTFSNAHSPKENAKAVPINRLLIETDAPYLTPHPLRGQLNEPQYVVLVNKEIARLREMSEKDLAKITFNNAARFFHVETN